jgi:hypothetical protein
MVEVVWSEQSRSLVLTIEMPELEVGERQGADKMPVTEIGGVTDPSLKIHSDDHAW